MNSLGVIGRTYRRERRWGGIFSEERSELKEFTGRDCIVLYYYA
jgi:hypothetical protein